MMRDGAPDGVLVHHYSNILSYMKKKTIEHEIESSRDELAEALADAAVRHGLDRDAAFRLAASTLHGAGLMAATNESLSNLRGSVTSKGGTTAAALDALTQANLEHIVEQAVAAAIERGRALSRQSDNTGG